MIRFACPGCQKAYKVPDEFAGRETKCRQCGKALRIPKCVSPRLPTPATKPAEPQATSRPSSEDSGRHALCDYCNKSIQRSKQTKITERYAFISSPTAKPTDSPEAAGLMLLCEPCADHILNDANWQADQLVKQPPTIDSLLANPMGFVTDYVLESKASGIIAACKRSGYRDPLRAKLVGGVQGLILRGSFEKAAEVVAFWATPFDPDATPAAPASAPMTTSKQSQEAAEADAKQWAARIAAESLCWFCEGRPPDPDCYLEVAGTHSINGVFRTCRPLVPRCANCAQVHQKASRLWAQYGCIGLPLGLLLVIACVALTMNLFQADHFKALGFLSIFIVVAVPIAGKIAVNRLLREHGTKPASDPAIQQRSLTGLAAGILRETPEPAALDGTAAPAAEVRRAEVVAAAEDLVQRARGPRATGDEYVDSCFRLNFLEKAEDRAWEQLADLRAILDLKNSGQARKALALAEAALPRYSDYDILYIWLADLRAEMNQAGEPQKTYLEGLQKCLRKEKVCANLGMAAFEAEDLAEAVRWWVRSCAAQMGGGKVANLYPFINLAYVAEGLGLTAPQARLLEWADAIDPLQTRFDATGANLRYRLAASQGTSAIARALATLCDFAPYAEEVQRQRPSRPGWAQPSDTMQEAMQKGAEFGKWLEEQARLDEEQARRDAQK